VVVESCGGAPAMADETEGREGKIADRVRWWYGSRMAASKVTFTLDEATVRRIDDAAAILAKPKSQVVREAVFQYYERIGRMSERERLEKLRLFDLLVPRIPIRSAGSVDRELKAIRQARQSGGRRSLSRPTK
jgi:Ribbon-helix-helix protein, copG family